MIALRRALWCCVAVLALSGCQLRTELTVRVEEDGSGSVEFAVAVDEETLAARPDLFDELAVDDLVASGWRVTGPTQDPDGFSWVRVRHDFGAAVELTGLVAEVAGEDGPFRDFTVVRDDAFASSRYRFRGVVDFGGGVAEVVEDPAVTEVLGVEPVALLEEQLGAALDSLVTVRVGVRLPGEVESNAVGATQASNGAIWQPSVLDHETITLSATGTVHRRERYLFAGVAVVAGFGLVLFVLIRIALWQRRRLAGSN